MKSGLLKVSAVGLEQLLSGLEEVVRVKEVFDHSVEERLEALVKAVPLCILEEVVKALRIILTPPPPKPHPGHFIVLAGLDRSGKETQCFNPGGLRGVKSVYDYLTQGSFRVLSINLPSYETLLGSLVGAYLGRVGLACPIEIEGNLSEDYAWILWSIDRAQHSPTVTEWLEGGSKNVVLAKRWTESNVVYQRARGIDVARVLRFERNIVQPSYTFIIDISVEEVFRRAVNSGLPMDRYEKRAFLGKVRANYLDLQRRHAFGKVFIINGLQSPQRVNQEVLGKLRGLGF